MAQKHPAQKQPVRGALAGLAGGLVAAWTMNLWSAGPGSALAARLETPEEKEQLAAVSKLSDGEDATMKTADDLSTILRHGQHLTKEEKAKDGPIVHYTFAALAGVVYGVLAEYSPLVRSGFGTTYAAALFTGGDLIAVPVLHLSEPLAAYPASSFAGPFTAHLVYGATTELVRRLVRKVL